MTAFLALAAVCFVLTLDNFQTSLGLGTTKPSWQRVIQAALVFATFDAVAPMLGVWVGGFVGDNVGETAEYVAAVLLACYAVFLVVRSVTSDDDGDFDHPLAILGMPIPLSADNLFAGASLGTLGYTAWQVAPVAGGATFIMSIAGLALGKLAATKVKLRTDLFSGIVLLGLAGFMVVAG